MDTVGAQHYACEGQTVLTGHGTLCRTLQEVGQQLPCQLWTDPPPLVINLQAQGQLFQKSLHNLPPLSSEIGCLCLPDYGCVAP